MFVSVVQLSDQVFVKVCGLRKEDTELIVLFDCLAVIDASIVSEYHMSFPFPPFGESHTVSSSRLWACVSI